MSTDDDLARARTRHPSLLPTDPSEDELARHWTLTSDDLAEVAQCRGADHRRRFALQLCTLRAYGRFLDDYRQAPLKIVSHLSRQLDLPPVLFLDPPGRGQTERAHPRGRSRPRVAPGPRGLPRRARIRRGLNI